MASGASYRWGGWRGGGGKGWGRGERGGGRRRGGGRGDKERGGRERGEREGICIRVGFHFCRVKQKSSNAGWCPVLCVAVRQWSYNGYTKLAHTQIITVMRLEHWEI